MVTENLRPAPGTWEKTVSVREDLQLERELVGRLEQLTGARSVGVTDLLAVRRAYYRFTAPPIPIPTDRQARLDRGRAVHRMLGSRLAGEGTVEARVRRTGIVGRIDILADVPVEVKTSSAFVDPSELLVERPDQIDQLVMYCALVDRPAGRLLTVVAPTGDVFEVQAVDLAFGSTERTLREMGHRAEQLRAAWSERNPEALPRCPWYGRGCEYEGAAVCSCTGKEEPAPELFGNEVGEPTRRPDVEERVRAALSPPRTAEEQHVERFREILYPRRAYFDRIRGAPVEAVEPVAPSLEPDLYHRLSEALESGPAGEVARLPPRTIEPDEEVLGFRGRPMLLKTSRARNRLRASELLTRFPQYALDLGLRCATTGAESGIVVLGLERATVDRDRVQVLEIRFASRTPFSRLYRERSQSLADALREQRPETLAACPEWMRLECPYRADCDCATAGARDTR